MEYLVRYDEQKQFFLEDQSFIFGMNKKTVFSSPLQQGEHKVSLVFLQKLFHHMNNNFEHTLKQMTTVEKENGLLQETIKKDEKRKNV